MSNVLELSVSELSGGIKRLVEENFGYVRVKGEISGFRGASPSGHVYFRLKDESAVIEAVIWKGAYGRLKFKPQEGLEMVATGKVTTFPGSSKYQIVVDNLEPAGAGALMAILEERKAKLTKEGLFDLSRKKPIPYLPVTIGVITSPTGAVIRDILHRLKDRFPRNVIIWGVRVQGDEAAGEITRAIEGFQAYEPRPDVIIVARGGGSLEDLWCFNEENVVRAAANSLIPLISAVGHETDTTLIDYASDKRAPTPTAAAEMAVPVQRDLVLNISALDYRMKEGIKRGLHTRNTALLAAKRGLPSLDRLLSLVRQRLDSAVLRLPQALKQRANHARNSYLRTAGKLSTSLLRLRVNQLKDRMEALKKRHSLSFKTYIAQEKHKITVSFERVKLLNERKNLGIKTILTRHTDKLSRLSSLINALSYKATLARGFALVRDNNGKPIYAAGIIKANSSLKIEFHDGEVEAITAKKPSQQQELF